MVVTFWGVALLAAAAGSGGVQWQVLEDGTELVVAHRPNSPVSSMHYVFRAGAAHEPWNRAGLSHLLEHLVFHGTYGMDGRTLWDRVTAAGGEINAFTGPDTVDYVLTAPSALFPALAADLIRMVTNPALGVANLESEVGVVATEEAYGRRTSYLSFLDPLVYASQRAGGVEVIGSTRSRNAIDHEELMAFYAAHYTPGNSSLVLVGALDMDAASALVSTHVLLPPSLPEDVPARNRPAPVLGVNQRTAGPGTLVLAAYRVAEHEARFCRDAAALVELRLQRLLTSGSASHAWSRCEPMRETLFVLVGVSSDESQLGELADWVGESSSELFRSAPTAAERAALAVRQRNTRADQWAGSSELAALLANQMGPSDAAFRRELVEALFAPPGALGAAQLTQTFQEDNRVVLQMSPAGG